MQVSVWRVALIPYSLLREEDHRGEDTVNDSVVLSLSTALSLFIVSFHLSSNLSVVWCFFLN